MAVRMEDVLGRGLDELRTYPVGAHVRAWLGDEIVISSDRAVLVWEPGRILPTYAVPVTDVFGDVVPERLPEAAAATGATATPGSPGARRIVEPGTPFGVHTASGHTLTVRTAEQGGVEGAAYAFDDPDLADLVALDFAAFSRWTEEEEPVVGHPQDPFHRVACRRTQKHVVVSVDGEVLADSHRAVLLLETGLPSRYYVPRADVRQGLLAPSSTRTECAYKGVASYWSVRVGARLVPDLAWSYEDPLTEAVPVGGHLCFWNERTDLTVDGEPVPRPHTAWSEPKDA